MAAVSQVYTIRYVARKLAVSEELIDDIALTDMDPEHGCLWICHTDNKTCRAFTPEGVEHLRELIADRATWNDTPGK